MNKLIEAAEAAVGSLENFVDRKVDAGEDGTGVQAIVAFLKEEIEAEKRTVKLGTHQIASKDLYRRIVDKLSRDEFDRIRDEVEAELDAGR